MNNELSITRLTESSRWVRVRGADATEFLQGQLSNDVRRLGTERAQLSSYNSPKGRMLAVLTLLSQPEGVDLELHASVAESVAKRLRMFVLRSKVTLTACDDSSVGLVGTAAADALRAAGLPVPAAELELARAGDDLRILRRIGSQARYSLHGPAAVLESCLSRFPASVWQPEVEWSRSRILAGEPVVVAATQDHFVPQMANLDRLGGISFDKGCYTGQEIVARLHYLGQLKRRLFLCRGRGDAPAAGTDVLVQGQEQAVGEIVEAAAEGDGFVASVVLQLAQAGSDDLHVAGIALSRPLPYTSDATGE